MKDPAPDLATKMAAAEAALRDTFGFESFRGAQRAVVEHMLHGGDALVVMPTGGGKSLLFQIPALVLPGSTVVLSPLIALMKDQVDQLRKRGIAATFINSSLSRREREKRTAQWADGKIDLLYVTPERFRSPSFLAALDRAHVSRLAVDEAHCASEWGHDFRPDYSRIRAIRARLGDPPTIALTATATPDVQREIKELVGIPDARLFHSGIERPNLFLACSDWIHEEDKWARVLRRLEQLPGAGIAYGALIKDLHRLEEHLQRHGHRPQVYHGGLSRDERRSMQERFMRGQGTRVLATGAFGMGVDKSDIRFVLHHQVPGSVEAYTQEVGRAGRDGQPSYCELLYAEQDLPIQTQFVEWANPDSAMLTKVVRVLEEWGADTPHYEADDLRKAVGARDRRDGRVDTCLHWLEVLGVTAGSFERRDLRVVRPLDPDEIPDSFGPEKRVRDLSRLLSLVEFIRSDSCRRAWLDRYFGLEGVRESCGACDRCVDPEEWLADAFPAGERAAPVVGETDLDDDADGLVRGAFVRIDGRFLGRVLKVADDGRVQVELADTLRVRSFRPRKHRIEVLEDGEA